MVRVQLRAIGFQPAPVAFEIILGSASQTYSFPEVSFQKLCICTLARPLNAQAWSICSMAFLEFGVFHLFKPDELQLRSQWIRKCGGRPPITVKKTDSPRFNLSKSQAEGFQATTTIGNPSQLPPIISPLNAGMLLHCASSKPCGAPNRELT